MAQSTGRASGHGSTSNCSIRSAPAISWSWTIWAATNPLRSAEPYGPKAQSFGICPPTPPTSIPSNRPSPRSSIGCEWLSADPSKKPGDTSDTSSSPSNPPNAQTTSQTLDMLQFNREMIYRLRPGAFPPPQESIPCNHRPESTVQLGFIRNGFSWLHWRRGVRTDQKETSHGYFPEAR